mmetsp:Transcript_21114/g.54927  ORF Transcript_21114/g.54927 Transcript_21114/m.54927 type:complete len:243 (-) Transcript_21114:952-1680(-)
MLESILTQACVDVRCDVLLSQVLNLLTAISCADTASESLAHILLEALVQLPVQQRGQFRIHVVRALLDLVNEDGLDVSHAHEFPLLATRRSRLLTTAVFTTAATSSRFFIDIALTAFLFPLFFPLVTLRHWGVQVKGRCRGRFSCICMRVCCLGGSGSRCLLCLCDHHVLKNVSTLRYKSRTANDRIAQHTRRVRLFVRRRLRDEDVSVAQRARRRQECHNINKLAVLDGQIDGFVHIVNND